MMNIGTIHFYDRSFPPEIRLEKQSRALIQSGYKVTVLTQKMREDEPSDEEFEPNFFVKRVGIKRSNIIA